MESVDTLNQRLIDNYGTDIVTNQPIYRIVKAWDQFEKRLGEYEDYTESGIFIRRVFERREVPKYRQILPEGTWVLEKLVLVPEHQQEELGAKISYEPLFVFIHFKTNTPLPPIWSVTRITIDAHELALGRNGFRKYHDMTLEEKEKELMEMENYLYGNETKTTDALAYKEGVVVPNNYGVEQ